MNALFWVGGIIEALAAAYYWNKVWTLKRGDPAYALPEKIRSNLYVASVLTFLVLAASVAKWGFQSPMAANIMVSMPAIMLALSMLGMMFATIFVGGKWR